MASIYTGRIGNLCCYCPSGKFCHRLILAEQVLPKLALRLVIAYQYKGEI
jgi:hypothetical protein